MAKVVLHLADDPHAVLQRPTPLAGADYFLYVSQIVYGCRWSDRDRTGNAAYSTADLFSHTPSKRPSAAMPPPRSMNLLPYRAKSFFENAEVVEHLHADVYTRMKVFADKTLYQAVTRKPPGI